MRKLSLLFFMRREDETSDGGLACIKVIVKKLQKILEVLKLI